MKSPYRTQNGGKIFRDEIGFMPPIRNSGDNMRLALISDTHTFHGYIELPPADVILYAGDITERGTAHEFMPFLEWFRQLPHACKIFIGGNHDFCLERPSLDVHLAIKNAEQDNVFYLDADFHKIGQNGIVFGYPYSSTFAHWAFHKEDEAILRDFELAYSYGLHHHLSPKDEGQQLVHILLTHAPPAQLATIALHYGSTSLDKALNKDDCPISTIVCGHVHETSGQMSSITYLQRIRQRPYTVINAANVEYIGEDVLVKPALSIDIQALVGVSAHESSNS